MPRGDLGLSSWIEGGRRVSVSSGTVRIRFAAGRLCSVPPSARSAIDASGNSVYVSSDAGRSWSDASVGLHAASRRALAFSADPDGQDVSTCRAATTMQRAGLRRGSGFRWETRFSGAIAFLWSMSLVLRPRCCLPPPDGVLYASIDGAATFTALSRRFGERARTDGLRRARTAGRSCRAGPGVCGR